jgi:hypothetical protein
MPHDEPIILTKEQAVGIYLNLVNTWLNRDYFYEDVVQLLRQIKEKYNL